VGKLWLSEQRTTGQCLLHLQLFSMYEFSYADAVNPSRKTNTDPETL